MLQHFSHGPEYKQKIFLLLDNFTMLLMTREKRNKKPNSEVSGFNKFESIQVDFFGRLK